MPHLKQTMTNRGSRTMLRSKLGALRAIPAIYPVCSCEFSKPKLAFGVGRWLCLSDRTGIVLGIVRVHYTLKPQDNGLGST